jgi:type IV secretion system protein VirB2
MTPYDLGADGSDALATAAQWLEGTLLGTVAITISTVAVASVGILTLSGHVDLRRGATVILGCFLLFGAPTIVAGIQSTAWRPDIGEESLAIAAVDPTPPLVVSHPPPPVDPYSRASLIQD